MSDNREQAARNGGPAGPGSGRTRVRPRPARRIRWDDPTTIWRIVIQVLFLAVIVAVGAFFYRNMTESLRSLGLTFNFRWLKLQAGFGISEGIAYDLTDTYGRAFVVGIVNTVKVVFFGIVFASVIGLVGGLARLSSNWLVRALATVYVEVFRNTPLLLQLLFWYGAVILKLPPVRQAVNLFDRVFLSQRGAYIPRFMLVEDIGGWRVFFIAAMAVSVAVYFYRRRQLMLQDRPGFPSVWALASFVVLMAGGWLVLGSPVTVDLPVLQRFNFEGGLQLTPEFTALLLGLSAYTGAFIAEVVRGGIQAVDKGQREAALALGLRPFHVQYLVIIPQALRIIVPPLTSQYLNLAKNSSLAVAIGYPELFNIGTTTMNQSGQTIPVFLVIIACYLSLSLLTSLFMNWWNRRLAYVQ